MELVIAHNPYSENPEELFEEFKKQTGISYLDTLEPDREGLSNLQSLLSPNMAK